MKLVIIAAILSCSTVISYCARPRIIGGHDAPYGKYPYMVSIRFKDSHFCGGSILNERWILTAAHCLKGFEGIPLEVVAGTNLLVGGNEQIYESEYIVIHEKYNDPLRNNDIGMIRVNRDIEFNDKVQPIALPKEEFYGIGDSVKLTGWGSTKLGGVSPNKLQEIDLKIYDQKQCEDEMLLFAFITKSHICTLTDSGKGVCHRDSGSPLVADGVQVGIASFSDPCAKGRPEVFTRVYTFLEWIAVEQAKF